MESYDLPVHLQGTLDGLCGAYAVINGITLLTGKIAAKSLFSFVIQRIGDRLTSVILDGMSTNELRRLIMVPSVQFCAKQKIKLGYKLCAGDMALTEYWHTIQQHCAIHGAGSIILGITGRYNHWTCVRRITEKTILLADSDGLSRLYRRHVSIGGMTKHRLRPKDTFLVTVQPK